MVKNFVECACSTRVRWKVNMLTMKQWSNLTNCGLLFNIVSFPAKCFFSCWGIEDIISLIPRLSHRLSYVTFRTISWSWNSSPTISWPRALRVRLHNTHVSYVCRAKCRARGTVEIRMAIGYAQLKRNHDLISVLHCHVRAHNSWLRNRISVVCI